MVVGMAANAVGTEIPKTPNEESCPSSTKNNVAFVRKRDTRPRNKERGM
jgi:hypothetical protein